MRLFIAIDLPDEVRNRIAEIQRRFSPADFDLAPVPPENLHITLKFLGDVSDDSIFGIADTMQHITENTARFTLAIGKVGYFTNPSYIRVIWVGIDDKGNALLSLMGKLHTALDYIRKEPLKPHPHLTVFRVRTAKNREQLLDKIERLHGVKIGAIDVKAIVLKQSQLGRSSPVYTDVKVFPLGKNTRETM